MQPVLLGGKMCGNKKEQGQLFRQGNTVAACSQDERHSTRCVVNNSASLNEAVVLAAQAFLDA